MRNPAVERKAGLSSPSLNRIQKQVDTESSYRFRSSRPDAFEPMTRESVEEAVDSPPGILSFRGDHKLMLRHDADFQRP